MALNLSLGRDFFDESAYVVRVLAQSTTVAITMCRTHQYLSVSPGVALEPCGISAHTDSGARIMLLQDDGERLYLGSRPWLNSVLIIIVVAVVVILRVCVILCIVRTRRLTSNLVQVMPRLGQPFPDSSVPFS
jgi:hypothetical protein